MGPGRIPLEATFNYVPSLSNCKVMKEKEISYRGIFSLFTLSNPIRSVIKFRIHSAYSVQPAVSSNKGFCSPRGKG